MAHNNHVCTYVFVSQYQQKTKEKEHESLTSIPFRNFDRRLANRQTNQPTNLQTDMRVHNSFYITNIHSLLMLQLKTGLGLN